MSHIEKSVLLKVILVLVVSISASAKVIYVDDDAGGDNDGTSWSNAYVYLQDALTDANGSPRPFRGQKLSAIAHRLLVISAVDIAVPFQAGTLIPIQICPPGYSTFLSFKVGFMGSLGRLR